MGQLVVDAGSFTKNSANGVTAYGTTVHFTIPANAGITGCSVSFVTQSSGGTTQDRGFSLNGVRAHSSGSWAQNGALNHALLNTGANTFRVTLKSRAGAACWWNLSSITLYITYNEGSGGGGPPTGGGGPVVISPSSIDAGAGNVTVTCPAEGGIWHMIDWTFGTYSGSWSHRWEEGGTNAINIPISWASAMPSAVSGTLAIRVRRSTTPAMPYSYATDQTTNVTINVPASVVPSIGGFGASRIANNTPAGIADYVQNVSGVSLSMSDVSGAYGSTISAYKITGAGYAFNASSGSISVLATSGNIAFTAEVTDSRGRKATKVVGIDVLAYSAVSASNVSAYRSDASKNPADEGVFATLRAKMVVGSLDGQNTGEVKGRVYEKGTAPPAWTTMSNDTLVLFGGSLSIEKVYTADILVADLITSYQHSIDIPTATVIMGISPDGDGVSFGTYPEAGKMKSAWPIYIDGAEVLKNYYLGASEDYYDVVIAYCATNNEDPNALSLSIGTLTAYRVNGLFEPYVFSVSMQKSYDSINAAGSSNLVSGGYINVHSRVSFIYNNKYYCGYRYALSPSSSHFYFHGRTYGSLSGFTRPFMINMRNTDTGTILNAEVWNSLVVI